MSKATAVTQIIPDGTVEGVYFFRPLNGEDMGPYPTLVGTKRAAGRAGLSGELLRCKVTTEVLETEDYVPPASR